MKERRYSHPGKDEKNKRHFGRGRKLAVLVFALGTIALCLAGCGAGKDGEAGGGGLPTLAEITAAAERTWSYTDAASSGGETENGEWLADDFAAADWSAATGSFGAKEGELKALADGFSPSVYLQHYNEDGEALPAYYFRLEFSAEAEDREAPLITEIAYDDAAIVYLNGEEIFSANAPEGGYRSPADYGCEETCGDPQKASFVLDTKRLREGKNVLAVELHQSDKESSDVYFAMGDFLPASAADLSENPSLQSETLCLGVGADDSQMLVTWRGPVCNGACVLLETAGDLSSDGAKKYPAEAVFVDKSEGTCTYRCVLSDLAPGEYFYRTVDDATSEKYGFSVPEESDGFSFLCHGDAQIIDDEDFYGRAVYETLAEKITEKEKPALVLSLGDQVDDGGDLALYRFFMSAPLLKSVPLAPVAGNHEQKYEEFSRAFYMPNVDGATVDKAGDMSGDYWFFRGNVLFLCLNSNNGDVSAHEKFMADAEAACEAKYGKPTWKVAALHFSFFSAGEHAEDGNIAEKRDAYAAAFEKAGVDAVFSGHDHSYTRSYPLQGSKPADEGKRGVVYFTLGSPTGSKLYGLNDRKFDYAAFSAEGKYPLMTRVDVTEKTMTVTTYQYRDGGIETLDTYEIEK